MRALVPVVKQTSGMDCGPAALHAAALGLGVATPYEEIRRRCNTDVDGTSINALEDTAAAIGLGVAQQLYPRHDILHPAVMPALLLVRGPADMPHVVVAWKRVGRFVQVMDPGVGRRWMTVRTLAERVIGHPEAVDAPAATGWIDAATADLDDVAKRIGAPTASSMTLASLDRRLTHAAALHATEAAVAERKVRRGREASELCELLVGNPASIPERHWFVRPVDGAYQANGGIALPLRAPDECAGGGAAAEPPGKADSVRHAAALVARAARARRNRLATAVTFVAAAQLLQIFAFWQLFRGALSAGATVALFGAAAIATAGAAMAFGAVSSAGASEAERGLRRGLLRSIPRKQLDYVRSRPKSDLLIRFQAAQAARQLVMASATAALGAAQILAVVVVAFAVSPLAGGALAGLLALVALLVASATGALLNADEERHRYTGEMSQVTYEAATGATAVAGSGGAAAIRSRLVELATRARAAGRSEARRSAAFSAGLTFSAIAATIATTAVAMAVGTGRELLLLLLLGLTFAATHVMQLGELARRTPPVANTTERGVALLAEGNPNDPAPTSTPASDTRTPAAPRGVGVSCRDLGVKLGDRTALHDVTITFAPGSRTLLVGPSGAGKSTLLSTIVGLYQPSCGSLRVGTDLGRPSADTRRQIAWCSAETTLQDASLRDNVLIGAPPGAANHLDDVLDLCELKPAHGFSVHADQRIGADGSLLSSGQAQLVRLARALMRKDARLVLLDECLRGVDPQRRLRILRAALAWWEDATVIAAAHPHAEELALFDRSMALAAGTVADSPARGDTLAELVTAASALPVGNHRFTTMAIDAATRPATAVQR